MITQAQKDKLFVAISKAKQYRGRHYTDNGGPCCVIGQLAFLEGIPISYIETWDMEIINSILGNTSSFLEPLRLYPRILLSTLQNQWDHGSYEEEEIARHHMIILVQQQEMAP
jgi:hypothetical protein